MYGAVNRKKKKNSEEFYTDMFYYVCKNRKMVSGKPCSYKRHIRQDEMDAEAVAILRYVLYHVDFKSVFEAQMKDMTNLESLNEKLQRLTEIYEKQEMKKSKLLAKIKALDPSDITYDDMYDNLQGLLREIIVELSQLEQQIEQTKGDIATERHIMFTVEQYEELAKDAIENLGKYSPAKRKALAQLFLDSIQIFEDKNEQGAWIKSVRLKMPLMFGEDEAYELSGFSFTANKTENPNIHIQDENSLPNENHDETVVLLSQLRQKPDDYIDVKVDVAELEGTSAETKATYEKIKKYVAEHNDGMKVSSLYIAQVKRKCGIELAENFNLPKSADARQPQCPKDKEEAIVEAFKAFQMI